MKKKIERVLFDFYYADRSCLLACFTFAILSFIFVAFIEFIVVFSSSLITSYSPLFRSLASIFGLEIASIFFLLSWLVFYVGTLAGIIRVENKVRGETRVMLYTCAAATYTGLGVINLSIGASIIALLVANSQILPAVLVSALGVSFVYISPIMNKILLAST